MIYFRKSVPLKTIVITSSVCYIAYRIFKAVLTYKYNSAKNEKEKCIVIESYQEWELQESVIMDTFLNAKVIGLDCEWVTVDGKRNPISLLQLATNTGFCVLLRLSNIPVWLIPSGLNDLLGNEDILKVGVAVADDANKLFCDFGVEVCGYLDLRHLAEDNQKLQGKSLSLKTLAHELLGIDLNKTTNLRCSDWEATVLSEDQIQYAAMDAIVAAKIFFELQESVLKKTYFRDCIISFDHLEKYVNLPYKQSMTHNQLKSSLTEKRHGRKEKEMSRRKPMYDNCQLVAPDGELLCNCKKGKAQWYVERGLGEAIATDPLIVRLNFEPTRRPRYDDVFYTKKIPNQCCVCGASDKLCRKSVVPTEYRRYFPDLMKKSLSHDVVLLCVDCHKISNIRDQLMRKKLSEICNAPFDSKKILEKTVDINMFEVQSAAKALSLSSDKIPHQRQEELRTVIKNYFKCSIVTKEILDQGINLKAGLSDKLESHSLTVYNYFCKNGGLIQLEKLWRQHFLDVMQPKHLPPMWSVDHNHKRLALFVTTREREINFDENILGLTQEMLDEFKHQS